MDNNHFKYKQFKGDFIILCVRWYLKYPLSLRDLKEIMQERGVDVCHTTIMRWVCQYSPILALKIKKILGESMKLILKSNRAIDSNGDTIDFLLTFINKLFGIIV